MKLLSFFSVGVLCAATHNLIIISANLIGLHYLLATAIGFFVAVVLGYKMHSRFTVLDPHKGWRAFLRYFSLMLFNLFGYMALMYFFVSVLNFYVWLSAPLSTGIFFVFNYFGVYWSLKKEKK